MEQVPKIINLPQGHLIISKRLMLGEPTNNFKQEDLGKIVDIYYI